MSMAAARNGGNINVEWHVSGGGGVIANASASGGDWHGGGWWRCGISMLASAWRSNVVCWQKCRRNNQ